MSTYYVDSAVGNDANAGTSAGSGNAWLTLGKAALTVAAGDKVNCKGTFNEILTLSTNGTGAAPIVWEGYASTVGDGSRSNQAVIEGGNTRATGLSLAGATYNTFKYFTIRGATSRQVFWTGTPDYTRFHLCRILKGSASSPASFVRSGYGHPIVDLIGCEVAGCTGVGVGTMSWLINRCEIHGMSGSGVTLGGYQNARGLYNSLIYDNGGDGLNLSSANTMPAVVGNTFDGNAGDAIEIGGAGNGAVLIMDNVFEHSGGYNINVVAAPSGTTQISTVKNFYLAGSSGHVNNTGRLTAMEADVLLSGDGLTNVGGDDFSLDSTTGEGAAIRAAAFGNAFPSGNTTSYRDGGAVQHADAGGGGTVIVVEDD